MAFGGMNTLAVVVAAIASFLFGGIWYGLFSRQWLAAAGLADKDLSGGWQKNITPFIVAFLALLVMAQMLAGVIGHLGPGQVTLHNGVISAGFIWLGFVMTTMVVNHTFQGARKTLTLIDGGHWLGVLLIQGAIIGAIGV